MTRDARSGCAINAAVEVLGDPWTLIVLRDMVFGGRRHFRELLSLNDEGIASNILSSRLKRLTEVGLVTRDDAVRGQRATYSLTEAGIQTVPVMVALGTWGLAHRPTEPSLAVRAQLLAETPELVEDLMDELSEDHLGHPARPDAPPRRASQLLAEAHQRQLTDQAVAPRTAHRPAGHGGVTRARLDLVTLVVDDYDRAIDFFTRVLGFALAEDTPSTTQDGRAKRWVVVRPPGGGSGVLLAQADGPEQEAAVGRQFAGRVGLFLRVEDVDGAVAEVTAAGCPLVRPARDEPYGRVAVIADPWGNRWDLLGHSPAGPVGAGG